MQAITELAPSVWLLLRGGHCSLSHSFPDILLSWLAFYRLPTGCLLYSHDRIPSPWPRRSHTLWWQTARLETQRPSQWEWLPETRSEARMTIFIILSRRGCQWKQRDTIADLSSAIVSVPFQPGLHLFSVVIFDTLSDAGQFGLLTSDPWYLCSWRVGSWMFGDHKTHLFLMLAWNL